MKATTAENLGRRERTVYDVQLDLYLDVMLDEAVPPPLCEWQRIYEAEPCGERASWILSLSCGHSFYYDEEHAERMKAATAGATRNACSAPEFPVHPRMTFVEIRFDRIAS